MLCKRVSKSKPLLRCDHLLSINDRGGSAGRECSFGLDRLSLCRNIRDLESGEIVFFVVCIDCFDAWDGGWLRCGISTSGSSILRRFARFLSLCVEKPLTRDSLS